MYQSCSCSPLNTSMCLKFNTKIFFIEVGLTFFSISKKKVRQFNKMDLTKIYRLSKSRPINLATTFTVRAGGLMFQSYKIISADMPIKRQKSIAKIALDLVNIANVSVTIPIEILLTTEFALFYKRRSYSYEEANDLTALRTYTYSKYLVYFRL